MRPDFIIIGAMKAGTTSLHYYLGLHPQISMSTPKELDFFLAGCNWEKGRDWYASHFRRSGFVQGESSPNYSGHPNSTGVPERMHQMVPDARLVYLLRDPVERMISQYVHLASEGIERRPLEEALLDFDGSSYLARSRYHMQVQRFLAHYPREQLHLLTTESLAARRTEVLGEVFAFLGVDASFSTPRFRIVRHRSRDRRLRSRMGRLLFNTPPALGLHRLSHDFAYHLGYALSYPFSRSVPRPVLAPETRVRLEEALAEDLRALRTFTGNAFNEWSC